MSSKETEYTLGLEPPVGSCFQELHTLEAADLKVELIAAECSQESPDYNPNKVKIAPVCSKACQNKDSLAFQEGARRYCSVSIGGYQGFK